jgi:hypothetical protein
MLTIAGTAAAYPQFELRRDQTCSGCHISPAGGGLLSENGTATSEAISQFGTSGEFMYGKVPTPSWLALGGDFRYAYGYLQTPQRYLVGFPMQGDIYGSAGARGFRVYVTVGGRPLVNVGPQVFPVWSREHYVMWHPDEDSTDGLYVRAGRFMPVFGLRLAEHTTYIRRYGGTQLYAETYGLALEYIDKRFETHLTGFIKDPTMNTVEHSNGAALYGEYRLDESTAAGLEGMLAASSDDKNLRAGATLKRLLPADVLVQGELQYIAHFIKDNGYYPELVSYLQGSWFATPAVMIDLGLGFYNEHLRVKGLDRESVDLNVHWFVTSHFEGVLAGRIEEFHFGSQNDKTSGPAGSYVLLMGHYRL